MRRYQKIKFGALFLCCICLFPILSAKADVAAAEEWVDIPVVVNIIDASDANNVDAAIKKANEILAQAHIRLIVKKTNKNVNVGNNDDNLNRAERDEARRNGQTALNNTLKAGKGIKIDIVTNSYITDASTTGVAVHRNPVVIIEPDAPNYMGETLAHEVSHVLTLRHVDDLSNLMRAFGLGGTVELDPNQINEIFQEAKKRGTAYFIVPRTLGPVMIPVAIPAGIEYSIDGFGAALDAFGDVSLSDLSTDTVTDESDDPYFAYADLRQVTAFIDDPFDPSGVLTVQWQLGGPIPPEHEDVDFWVDLGIYIVDGYDADADFVVPDGVVMVHNPPGEPPYAIWWDAASESKVDLQQPIIHKNEEFDTDIPPKIVNDTVEVTIPIEIINMSLGAISPLGPKVIMLDGTSWVADFRNDPFLPTIVQDYVDLFDYGLTGPPPGPDIFFVPGGVLGRGFTPDAEVGVWVDSSMAGISTAHADGTFTFIPFLPIVTTDSFTDMQALAPGPHSVIAKEFDDSGPTGAPHAIGFFITPE